MSFFERFKSVGARPAFAFPGGRTISYAELARRSEAIAGELGSAKRLVAVRAARSEHALIAYVAARAGGHAVALLPPCDADVGDTFEVTFRPDTVFACADGRFRRIDARSEPAGGLHPDLSVLLGTSGSTGRSRFVRLSHGAVTANEDSIRTYLDLGPDDRSALVLPWHYSYGLSVVNSHLAAGACIYLAQRSPVESGFVEEMRIAAPTNIAGVPFTYESMMQAGVCIEDLPSLRFLTVAGGRLSPDLVEAFHARLAAAGKRFYVMYGQTEATARIAYVPPGRLAGITDAVGIAIPGGSLRLVDGNGAEIAEPRVAGELAFRGPNVMMGYADRRADLARGREIEELRTGDIATRDESGLYRIVGRARRMSKIAGLRIHHDAMEAMFAARGISAAVTGDDRRLAIAFATEVSERDVLTAAVASSGLNALAIDVKRLPALPRLDSGKVDLQEVGRLFAADQTAERSAGDAILAAYRRAFFPRAVSRSDSFSGLGGDSLAYVQLAMSLERAIGSAPEGWEAMRIDDLARVRHSPAVLRPVDTELVMRAAAILLIVLHHATLWPIPGGAAVLLMLVGFGLARFQSRSLLSGDPSRLLASAATNLALYVPIVLGYCLVRGDVLWPSLLFIGNFAIAEPPEIVPYLYWFVEAYAQIVLLVVALFSIRSVRDRVAAQPFMFGLCALGLAIAMKFTTPLVWDLGGVRIFTVPDVLHLAVLGWCIHFARRRREKVAVVIACMLALPYMAYWGGNWVGSWTKYGLVFGSVLLLTLQPRLLLPAPVLRAVLPVAAASFHIYLFHRILPEIVLPQPDPATLDPLVAAIAVAGGVATGFAVHRLQGMATALVLERRRAVGQVLIPAE